MRLTTAIIPFLKDDYRRQPPKGDHQGVDHPNQRVDVLPAHGAVDSAHHCLENLFFPGQLLGNGLGQDQVFLVVGAIQRLEHQLLIKDTGLAPIFIVEGGAGGRRI